MGYLVIISIVIVIAVVTIISIMVVISFATFFLGHNNLNISSPDLLLSWVVLVQVTQSSRRLRW